MGNKKTFNVQQFQKMIDDIQIYSSVITFISSEA